MDFSELGGDLSQFKTHTGEQVAAFALELFDSDCTLGMITPHMTFELSQGKHKVSQLFGKTRRW